MDGGRKGVREDSLLSLEIPADPAHLSTARLFVASIARHYGIDEESVDDLKVALSEACTSAISVRQAASSEAAIEITASVAGSRLTFEVEDGGTGVGQDVHVPLPAQKLETSTEEMTRLLGLSLIPALFPEYETATNDSGGSNIRFALEIPADVE